MCVCNIIPWFILFLLFSLSCSVQCFIVDGFVFHIAAITAFALPCQRFLTYRIIRRRRRQQRRLRNDAWNKRVNKRKEFAVRVRIYFWVEFFSIARVHMWYNSSYHNIIVASLYKSFDNSSLCKLICNILEHFALVQLMIVYKKCEWSALALFFPLHSDLYNQGEQ